MHRTWDRRRTAGRRAAPPRTTSAGRAGSGAALATRRRAPAVSPRTRSQLLREGVSGEAADPDVLTDGGDPVVDQVTDRTLLVTEGLIVEADLRVPLLQLAL